MNKIISPSNFSSPISEQCFSQSLHDPSYVVPDAKHPALEFHGLSLNSPGKFYFRNIFFYELNFSPNSLNVDQPHCIFYTILSDLILFYFHFQSFSPLRREILYDFHHSLAEKYHPISFLFSYFKILECILLASAIIHLKRNLTM